MAMERSYRNEEKRMTERSISSGRTPQIVIRSGGDVVVKGWDSDRLLAESGGRWGLQLKRKRDAIEVQLGASGQVLAPFDSNIKVYAGKSAEIEAINGTISAFAGRELHIIRGHVLAQASAGGGMDIDCRMVVGRDLELSAGRDLRCWLRDLKDVIYLIDDLGGRWQATFGGGSTVIRLKAGGDVTLVTDQTVTGQPPDYIFGRIEQPR